MSGAPTTGGRAAVSARQRWLARAAIAAVAAGLIVLASAEQRIGLTLFVVGLLGAALVLVGGYWFLARHGVLRWAGLALALVTVLLVVLVFLQRDVVATAVISLGLLALGVAAAHVALYEPSSSWMPTSSAPPVRHPFIVMNPHAGGGKVVRFDLERKAEALGAEVALMEGPGHVDVGALVRDAVARGADLLGVAGGDGTQALVAGIAADQNLPLLVVTAGTRNHFALDLGLDRNDPSTCLAALTDGEEVRVDLGMVGERPFVNNASFGAYAEIVASPQYRDNKNRTALDMLPDLLAGGRGHGLSVTTGTARVVDAHAVLVSNNPYAEGRLRDAVRRPRLDRGVLGVLTGRLGSAADAVSLLRRAKDRSVQTLTATSEVVVAGQTPTIAVGIDGESLTVASPASCTIRPRALRVRIPRVRPGVPKLAGRLDIRALLRAAFGRA